MLWEQRIESMKESHNNIEPIDEKYFMVHKALALLNNQELLNPNDRSWINKSREEISKLSLNQLKLWTTNYKNLITLGYSEYNMETDDM